MIATVGFLTHAAGFRVNTTASMPLGLWRIQGGRAALHAGDIVLACPPDQALFHEAAARGYLPRGTCASGLEPLLKPVAALEGDVVTVSAEGVTVNGSPIPATGPLVMDTAGRPLQSVTGRYAVGADQVWLVSGYTPRSWDSRYFGALPATSILGMVRPVWVWR